MKLQNRIDNLEEKLKELKDNRKTAYLLEEHAVQHRVEAERRVLETQLELNKLKNIL